MKFTLSLLLIVFGSLICVAQTQSEKADIAARQRILKKQILVDDLDTQAKNVSLVAVRVFVRTKLAEWLWRNGKDETGRAELIAVKAAEELYEKKNEVPNAIFLSAELFALLELNAKDAAKKLRAKYKIEDAEDLSNASSLLSKEGGDKIVAAKIKKALQSGSNLDQIHFLIYELRDKKSPEFLSVLFEIINVEETGRNNFTPLSLFWVIDYYRGATVPIDLKIRFYRIVTGKARNALQNSDTSGSTLADILLSAILPDINANAPELAAEAMALNTVLSAKTSQSDKELQERNKRIEESADRLDALISEAEKAESKNEKHDLYISAALLATKREKFRLAVDMYEKALENMTITDASKPAFNNSYYDQQLGEIVQAALKKNDVDSARYTTKKIIGDLYKAGALRRTAVYFIENKDSGSALNAYDEALKLAVKAEDGRFRFYTLFQLISAAQKIDADRVAEVTTATAKAIDNLPTLNPEDKPETENFKNYVSTIMAINVNVNSVMRELSKKNKSEATDFAIRINLREVKIVADLVLTINAFEPDKKPTAK